MIRTCVGVCMAHKLKDLVYSSYLSFYIYQGSTWLSCSGAGILKLKNITAVFFRRMWDRFIEMSCVLGIP